MARITNYNPPAGLAKLLKAHMHINKLTALASASAYPSAHVLRAPGEHYRWTNPLNLQQAADWMIQYGPATWRSSSRKGIRSEILNGLAARQFSPEFWAAATPVTDRIEVAYPTVTYPEGTPPNPEDPNSSANTWCEYYDRAAYWNYSQATENGWPPLTGWQGAIDTEHYYVDTWHAQRSLTYPVRGMTSDPDRYFALLRLTGTITATAEDSGVRAWFAPVWWLTFHANQANADAYAHSCGGAFTHLTDYGLALPTPGPNWAFSITFDRVLKVRPYPPYSWTRYTPWLNLKLSVRAPMGTYRAQNLWAKCHATLTPTVYYPSFF